jgi:hypothetical protein
MRMSNAEGAACQPESLKPSERCQSQLFTWKCRTGREPIFARAREPSVTAWAAEWDEEAGSGEAWVLFQVLE